MPAIIIREWARSDMNDHVCDYSTKHKWGHYWKDKRGTLHPTACPIGYDQGTFAPPKRFHSYRYAKKLARRLGVYWRMPHRAERVKPLHLVERTFNQDGREFYYKGELVYSYCDSVDDGNTYQATEARKNFVRWAKAKGWKASFTPC